MARFYIQSTLSEHIAETPEGYLLCSEVPIARTGSLEYLPEEVPITPAGGKDVITIYRLAEDLFSPETIASFEGKTFVVTHPADGVNPDNWRDVAVGHAQNVRRGSGAESDLLLADVLVTDREAIIQIQDEGIREISCGYDAEYEEIAPGIGKQTAIIGNHVALVEAGRCGPRCAVRDQKGTSMKPPVKKSTKVGFFDRVFGNPKVRRVLDEAAAETAQDEEVQPETPPGEQQSATDDDKLSEILMMLQTIMDTIKGNTGDEDPQTADNEIADDDPTNDEGEIAGGGSETQDDDPPANTTQDARRYRSADKATVSRALVLAPGLHARVGDSAVAIQRTALRIGMSNPNVKRTVDAVTGGKPFNKVDRVTLDAAFNAASEMARLTNNGRTADTLTAASGAGQQDSIQTPADLNALYSKHYGMKG